jgi:signal transduction histidine kinase
MKPLLERIVSDTSELYPKVDISFMTEIQEAIEAEVDDVMFEQAIRNIVMNAAQACLPEGKVMVSARLGKGFWDLDPSEKDPVTYQSTGEREYFLTISVKDNGPGIPENVREKIFVPFFTTKKGGTGIGLSIVQKIVYAHKGVLDIISELGKGTEFIIKVPLKPSSNA